MDVLKKSLEAFNENKYNELMMDSFDANNHGDIVCHQEPSAIVIDDDDGISNDELPLLTPENHKSKIIDAVTKLNTLVPEQKNRYHIRRKTVFDDYVNTRERSKWMKPENKLKVSFIGEPGLDGGGPRREFLTGTYCTYCSDYEYSCYKIKHELFFWQILLLLYLSAFSAGSQQCAMCLCMHIISHQIVKPTHHLLNDVKTWNQ